MTLLSKFISSRSGVVGQVDTNRDRRLLDQQRHVPGRGNYCLRLFGYLLLLDFHSASILLGFVLGPRFEENCRRVMLISRGDIFVFVEQPISAFFCSVDRYCSHWEKALG